MQLAALNRLDPPPRFPSRPARLARATATGLLAALVLVAVSRTVPAREIGEVGQPSRPGGTPTRVRRLATVGALPERTRPRGARVVLSAGAAVPVAC